MTNRLPTLLSNSSCAATAWQPLGSPPGPVRTSVEQGQAAGLQGQAAGVQGQAAVFQGQAAVVQGQPQDQAPGAPAQAQVQSQSQAQGYATEGGLDWSFGESRVLESDLRPPARLDSPILRAMSLGTAEEQALAAGRGTTGLGLAAVVALRVRQGLTLVHFSAQFEPCLTQKATLHTLNISSTRATQPLRAPPIPYKALKLS
jgi:hypothetical protein